MVENICQKKVRFQQVKTKQEHVVAPKRVHKHLQKPNVAKAARLARKRALRLERNLLHPKVNVVSQENQIVEEVVEEEVVDVDLDQFTAEIISNNVFTEKHNLPFPLRFPFSYVFDSLSVLSPFARTVSFPIMVLQNDSENCKLSDIISSDLMRILNFGLKYVPFSSISRKDILNVIDKFKRSLLCSKQFGYTERPWYKRKRSSKVFIPDGDVYVDQLCSELKNVVHMNFSKHVSHIYSISSDYVLTRADKSLGYVIVSKSMYERAALKYLEANYEITNSYSFDGVVNMITHLPSMKALNSKDGFPDLYKFICSSFAGPFFSNQLYLLAKTHKPDFQSNPKWRPIIPNTRSFLKPASVFVDHLLKPLLSKYSQVLNSSLDLIHRLDEIDCSDCVFITFDVDSLYDHIHTDISLPAIRSILVDHHKHPVLVNAIVDLINVICKNNIVKFGDKLYRQKGALAMGTPCAPTVAILTLVYLEIKWIAKWSSNWKLFVRYIDDGLIVLKRSSLPLVDAIMNHYNHLATGVHITYSVGMECNFLDLHLTINGDGTLSYGTFHKPTRMVGYTYPFGCQLPDRMKFGFIHGENIRLIRSSSSEAIYVNQISRFKAELKACGFNPTLVDLIIARKSYADRPTLLKPKTKLSKKSIVTVPLVVPYNNVTQRLLPRFQRVLSNSIFSTHVKLAIKPLHNVSRIVRKLCK